MTMLKTPELSYRPAREGGEDQLHTHGFNPSAYERESCGACAQLANDFAWAAFYDATKDLELPSREDAVARALSERELVA